MTEMLPRGSDQLLPPDIEELHAVRTLLALCFGM